MEQFAMQVLQNDVEHLEKNMKTVFQQLRILQDFVQLEFGSKFQDFYAQQLSLIVSRSNSQSQGPSQNQHGARVTGTPTVVVSSYNAGTTSTFEIPISRGFPNPGESVHNGKGFIATLPEDTISRILETEEDEIDDMDEIVVKPEFFQLPYSDDDDRGDESNDENEDEFERDPLIDFSGNERSEADSEYTHSASREAPNSRRGKKYPEVWKHFKNSETSYSKAECKKCGTPVSNRLGRLKAHLQRKCVAVQQGLYTKTSASVEPITNSTAVANKSPALVEDKHNNPSTPKLTKSKSAVRKFFVPWKVDGILKSKCLQCGKPVSNKALRLKKHYEQCVKTKKYSIVSMQNVIEMDESLDNQHSLYSGSSSTFVPSEQNTGFNTLNNDSTNTSTSASQDLTQENIIVNVNFTPPTEAYIPDGYNNFP